MARPLVAACSRFCLLPASESHLDLLAAGIDELMAVLHDITILGRRILLLLDSGLWILVAALQRLREQEKQQSKAQEKGRRER